MRILLASSEGIGAWHLLRLQQEGHEVDWFEIEPKPRRDRVLKGLIPPPLESKPRFSSYDLCVFDSSGHGELADDIARVVPVIGDSILATRLEDDRLYGIEIMEQCGIEVPAWETFQTPEEAKPFLLESGKRYVYKPFVVNGEEQESDCTYVSESAEDLLKCIDRLYAESKSAPFLLQEVVEGIEFATNGYFDGSQFHFVTHTLEEKKFMSGGFGPNTGCSGNLIYWPPRDNKLIQQGLEKLVPFLHNAGYRGPIDLNTIVNENHAYGLEFTPRFGYDSTATEFSMLDGDLGQFLHDIATAPNGGWVESNPVPRPRGRYAASARLSAPPYPEEEAPKYAAGLPIKGIDLEWCWRDCYLWDAQLREGDLETLGINGIIASPVAPGHTPEGAWKGVERIMKGIKFPNLQRRDDLDRATMKRFNEVHAMGWI
jgi:phosphoribosylamine-glycine ligase